MTYEEFCSSLENAGWVVRGKSFIYRIFADWQISFIRMGGRYQEPGKISFVICIRHTTLRNLESNVVEFEKDPHSYPFKLSLAELEKRDFRYKSKLLNYDVSKLEMNGDWVFIHQSLVKTLPDWLSTLSKDKLIKQITKFGESGYIEKIWIEDLLEPAL